MIEKNPLKKSDKSMKKISKKSHKNIKQGEKEQYLRKLLQKREQWSNIGKSKRNLVLPIIS